MIGEVDCVYQEDCGLRSPAVNIRKCGDEQML